MGTSLVAQTIGRRVSEQRAELGLTQREVARRSGVSERLIRDIENGVAHGVGLDKLVRVVEAISLTITVIDWLGPADQAGAREG